MFTVKISAPFSASSIICQTPANKIIWGNCKFYINENVTSCNYWFVYEDLLSSEQLSCPKKNIVLITGEPPSIKKYSQKFLEQFATVITCHRTMKNINTVYTQQALPWHVGKRLQDRKEFCYGKDYDELKTIKNFNKSKLISIIVSGKNTTKGHKNRLKFVERLKSHFKERLDVFSRDNNPIDDKWDGIADYKYHIVIENSNYEDYWTEKLADSFLAGAYPFYCGCPNVGKYFSKSALSEIDINNVNVSIKIIEDAIKNNKYENSINSIMEARTLVLDTYNLFPFICNYVKKKLACQMKLKLHCILKKNFLNKKIFYT